MARRLAVAFIIAFLAFAPSARPAEAQSASCSSYSFPFGNWQLSGDTATTGPGGVFVTWFSTNQIALHLSFDTFQDFESVTVTWNPGVTLLDHFSVLDVATYKEGPAGIFPVEQRLYEYNNNKNITNTFYFSNVAQANALEVDLQAGTTLIPANISAIVICMAGGVPPGFTATNTAIPTSTSGGPTFTNTPAPTASRTPTASFTASTVPTHTSTPPAPTAGPSPTGGPSPTPGAGTPIVLNSGNFAPVPPPPACNDPLHPCGINPFMPNGIPTYRPIVINTIIPVTSVNTPIAPVFGSGPTSTGTITPAPSSTLNGGILDGIASYATGIAGIGENTGPGAGLTGTEQSFGFLGLDGSTNIDAANGANEVGSRIGDLFGTFRASTGFFLGRLGTIITFIVLVIGFTFTWRFVLWLIPIIMALFRLFLQLIQAILPW